jgi:hypothetical protein
VRPLPSAPLMRVELPRYLRSSVRRARESFGFQTDVDTFAGSDVREIGAVATPTLFNPNRRDPPREPRSSHGPCD